jgi:hypothetical protein
VVVALTLLSSENTSNINYLNILKLIKDSLYYSIGVNLMSDEITIVMELSAEEKTSLELAQVFSKLKWLLAHADLDEKQKANLREILKKSNVELDGDSVEAKHLLMGAMQLARELNPQAASRNRGNVVFAADNAKVKDKKDHFPINSEAQARNALARAGQYSTVPPWFNGTLEELKQMIADAVKSKFPSIEVTEAKEMQGASLEELLDMLEELMSALKHMVPAEEYMGHPMAEKLKKALEQLPSDSPVYSQLKEILSHLEKLPMEMGQLLELNSDLLENLNKKEEEIVQMKNAIELSDISMAMEASEQLKKAALELTRMSSENTEYKSKIDTYNSQVSALSKQLEDMAKHMKDTETELISYKSVEEKRMLAEKNTLVGQVLELSKDIGESFKVEDFNDYNLKQLGQFKEVLELKAKQKRTPVRETVKNTETISQKKKFSADERAELLLFSK